ncbi:E1 [Bovine papillomavirus type 8-EB]|uniref:Replication protein E1 n=2 Tax=Bos taurus papillomavirus 8 TaxID=2758968 RepID=A6XAA1_9PAPI|nr:E1 [Bos taurus papillomavirus 8]ABD60078.1 E1 [Bovine papillomavirus type 8-EB]QYI89651.1 E1 early protein [Bos taurus papillomavirus 8]QYI89659.1 E1 early protein [Bos taurus papillomavirus 8]
MANNPGRLGGNCFILEEALCISTDTEGSDSEKENQDDADFVDNAPLAQGNTLALFQTQLSQAGKEKVNFLKGKLLGDAPRVNRRPLQSVDQNSFPAAKRRLFDLPGENEASPVSSPASQVRHSQSSTYSEDSSLHMQILKSKNSTACKLAIFKFVYAVSYCDLTRPFKNDRTTNNQWVAAVFGVSEELFSASKLLLGRECCYLQGTCRAHEKGSVGLLLLSFKVAKSRETVTNLLRNVLNVAGEHMLLQPPKIRGVTCALFWYKMSLSPHTYTCGTIPRWVEQQILLTENTSTALKFDFSQMVQWALDNEKTEECTIAFYYAQLADTDANARAWLSLNNQAKIVKDVCTMVHHYQRAMMRNMTMSAYIHKMCQKVTGQGSWLVIMQFLQYQGIEPIRLVNCMKDWLKGIPKKNCIAIIGQPNTGKSLFTNSLTHFLQGKVLSFANSASHFWLSPLTEAKMALIDDATSACLKYCDTYLRNFLDGYSVCVDRKHRTSVQIKAPPLLVTSNIDIQAENKYSYLQSRVTCFYFNEQCPLDEEGKPVFTITDADWKSFFERLWERLELSDQEEEEEEGDDGSSGTFKCSSRNTNDFN